MLFLAGDTLKRPRGLRNAAECVRSRSKGGAIVARLVEHLALALALGREEEGGGRVLRRWLSRGGRRAVESALLPALWASVVLLHPLLDGVFGEHVAAGGDARVIGGDVVKCDAALLLLLHCLRDDHGGDVWGQVRHSSTMQPEWRGWRWCAAGMRKNAVGCVACRRFGPRLRPLG